MVTLHKVEGHSDDYWNNKADELANGGSQIKDPIIVNHKFFQRKSLGFISWNNIYIIDRNDWSFTREWINTNPLDTPCSAKLSKIQGNKIKKLNFAHPTIDIQQRNYPRLYPRGIIPCVECNSAKDNNEHIGLCTAHTTIITQLISDASDILLTLISSFLFTYSSLGPKRPY
ncbi:ribonuclease H-like domain-containing protein [Rhizophagus irregularis DAOM 181602=DAOM 197198]|nr:ribonuclease H-like domain-containing protein [Rhizophagus irregularis DAOM 181602=DAOM 197198]